MFIRCWKEHWSNIKYTKRTNYKYMVLEDDNDDDNDHGDDDDDFDNNGVYETASDKS